MSIKDLAELLNNNSSPDQHKFYVTGMTGTAETEKEIEDNKRLVKKFPWLWPSDWCFAPVPEEEYDYSWTVLDEFPVGWKIAFAEKMCEEIQAVLEKYDCVKEFHIDQLKEKYGGLRLYFSGINDPVYSEIQNIIDKYEEISAYTCCECGKPATQITTGWICPYCDDHDVNGIPIANEYKGYNNLVFSYDENGYICDIRSVEDAK